MRYCKTFSFLAACCLIIQCFIGNSPAHAEGSLEESIDCTDVRVDYSDNPDLTSEERIRLMDKAFFDSLNRFEQCQAAKEKAKASAGGGSDGTGGNGGSEGDSGNGLSGESMADTEMSGTESLKEYPPAEGFETLEPKPLQSQKSDETISQSDDNQEAANGKTPDDIPPAKNDDALAAQIRYAAEHEPDPVKRRQLWNEYRKYKGLATQQE